ncbi:MAG: PEP/pyruvate-binding domain-containing protein [Dehalococcoidia bacterium]
MSKKWISWFEELCHGDSELVGKKCANLGEMTKMGLRVPPGFALSVEAYRDFMDMTGAIEEISRYLDKAKPKDIKQFTRSSAEIRQIVQSKPMPAEMEKTVVSCYRELCRQCGTEVPISTRSAGPSSHPGQYETYLNVIGGSDLVDKIKKVWASTFNPRSLAFRNRKKMPLESDPIGVAVLKMVNARAAGVIFTADPNTGDTQRMIIEANWGLGESVVSGDSTPDVFILDKASLEIKEKKLGPKCHYVTCKEVGVAEEELPAEKTEQFCLSDDEAREIGRLGKVLEEHFGKPQDVEWGVEEGVPLAESVVLLQTRPEVIAKTKPPVDKIVDLMLDRISKGVGFEGLDM